MRAVYVDKNIPRIALITALRPVWPDVVFSPLSPARFASLPDDRLPGPRWVRVTNQQCGICGSDITLLLAKADLGISPAALPGTDRFYLGHEITGRVAEAGPGVTLLKPGDRVVMDSRFQGRTCLSQEISPPCPHCQAGRYALCENASRGLGPASVGGGWGDSFFAHETELYRVTDESLSDDEVTMIEPLSTGVRAVLRRSPPAGGRALILGAGIVGLNVLQCLRALGPKCHVTVLGRHRQQTDMARRLGADEIMTGRDAYEQSARITGASLYRGALGNTTMLGGFDVVYDCVGSARTLQDSLRWAKAGGAVLVVGLDMHPLRLDLTPVWHQEVDLTGVHAHGGETWQGRAAHPYDLIVDLYKQKRLTAEGLITHRIPLSRWPEAVKTAMDKSSGSIKVVIDCQA
jgi:threonine dehydrogenase-like Zn-dependent dehydrogenase